ncbi:PASTA domain-containing protein [Sinomonas gamaensis]|uniref:PASTA domain-containing protein n=1 Tax=Sinomonas gamaensis TaxID=2565624 RepID=UPI0011089DFD|nr:PASTA domain-containing protein [Sinomonas gamaensis]
MKRHWIAAWAAPFILVLAGCGGGESSARTTAKPVAAASIVVPDVTGQSAREAAATMGKAGLQADLFGSDGQGWTGSPDDPAKALSTDPAAGTQMIPHGKVKIRLDRKSQQDWAAQPPAAPAASSPSTAASLTNRYSVTCGYSSDRKYSSYKDVWTSPEYQASGYCETKIDGKDPVPRANGIALLPQEQAIVNVVALKGGDVSNPARTFANIYSLCASVPKDYADHVVGISGNVQKPGIEGALALCPDTPHAALLQQALTSVKIDSGSYAVGKDMLPGTYSTAPGVRQCYWSRSNGAGDIIANNFIDYAPNGATVTVYAGEGFTSDRCGVWTKVP